MAQDALTFGPFQLVPGERLLLQDGKPLRLGSRALDILLALAARAGETVGKETLVAQVWPGTFVEESALRVHIAALRKALGDGQGGARYIANIPGRGYCFVAPVTREIAREDAPQPAPEGEAGPRPAVASLRALPSRITRVIGRDETVSTLAAQLARQRLLTIVGPGGMGKTTVALEIAATRAASYRDGVAYLDLGAIDDARQVPGALAVALGLKARSENPLADLATFLGAREMLLLLDSCENLIEAAATLAEALLGQAPGIHLLATSREPLRAAGEWVQRLPPLGLPPETGAPTAAEAMDSPAVQLFVERASAALGGYALDDAEAPAVAEICRRLDGIALAIELAAGRLDTMGVQGLAGSLADCFRILTRGRRTALPRHQTLRATLDWSFRLLPESEQAALRRLAVFSGAFTQDAAQAILAGTEVEEAVSSLAAKSLLVAERTAGAVRYRLLDTTRAYAREKLEEAGELASLGRRHAGYYRALFERADAEWETRPTQEWLAAYVPHLGNLRAALDWAFSPGGDDAVGVALSVAALPLWFQLSQIDECLARVRQSLARLATPANPAERRQLMQLHAALGWPQLRAIADVPNGAAAWRRTLALAEELGDLDYQLRALWALWVDRTNSGEPREALALADRFCALAAAAGEADRGIGDRMRARSLAFLGDLADAQTHIARMLAGYVAPPSRAHRVRFQYDQRVTARITLARLLWLRGFPDQALREIEDNVADAIALDHTLTLAHALADAACPVALLAGDLDRAERFTAMLHAQTAAHALDIWNTYAACYAGELAARRGEAEAGLTRMSEGVERLRRGGFVAYQTAFLRSLAEALIAAGRPEQAAAALDEALTQCGRTGEAWCLPELLRLKGEALLQGGDSAAADGAMREALRVAQAQGALSWELRAATGLARLRRAERRPAEALALLAPVLARFTEGFTTPDLTAAAGLVAELRRA